jgi:replication factor A1
MKSVVRTWKNQRGEGKVFSVDVIDAEGCQIRATTFNAVAERLYEVFQHNLVYTISRGKIKVANKQFNTLRHHMR